MCLLLFCSSGQLKHGSKRAHVNRKSAVKDLPSQSTVLSQLVSVKRIARVPPSRRGGVGDRFIDAKTMMAHLHLSLSPLPSFFSPSLTTIYKKTGLQAPPFCHALRAACAITAFAFITICIYESFRKFLNCVESALNSRLNCLFDGRKSLILSSL